MSDHAGATLVSGAVTVTVSDERDAGTADAERWGSVVLSTALAEGVSEGTIDVIFVDEATIAELNETHMGSAGPTDVLSFPLDDGTEPDLELPGMVPHVGDIVLCPSVAEAQAPSHAGNLDAEMTLLLVHGVLHLLGHDHAEPDETTLMRERECVHLERYQIAHPTP